MEGLARAAKLERPMADYMRRNLYVTASGMFSHPYLKRAIEIVGIDRILFSVDYPFQYRPGNEARRFLDETALDGEDRRKFAHANWERLTGRTSRA
jgi:predicted TIM-barrel fold metal-dependent hydrolase